MGSTAQRLQVTKDINVAQALSIDNVFSLKLTRCHFHATCVALRASRQGDFKLRHRFWLRRRSLSDFSGPARCLAHPDHRFSNGWLMSACKPDGALVTLAMGELPWVSCCG